MCSGVNEAYVVYMQCIFVLCNQSEHVCSVRDCIGVWLYERQLNVYVCVVCVA